MLVSVVTIDALEDLLNREWRGAKALHETDTHSVDGEFELMRAGRVTLLPGSVTRIPAAKQLPASPVRELISPPPGIEFCLSESGDRLIITWALRAPLGIYVQYHKLTLTRVS